MYSKQICAKVSYENTIYTTAKRKNQAAINKIGQVNDSVMQAMWKHE